jgi:hypothetical protein
MLKKIKQWSITVCVFLGGLTILAGIGYSFFLYPVVMFLMVASIPFLFIACAAVSFIHFKLFEDTAPKSKELDEYTGGSR